MKSKAIFYKLKIKETVYGYECKFFNLWEHFSEEKIFFYNENDIQLNLIGNVRLEQLLDKDVRNFHAKTNLNIPLSDNKIGARPCL